MRGLTERDGFPDLPQAEIGMLRGRREKNTVTEALISHIRQSLDAIYVPDYSVIAPHVTLDAIARPNRATNPTA